jgi:hypothetical protein
MRFKDKYDFLDKLPNDIRIGSKLRTEYCNVPQIKSRNSLTSILDIGQLTINMREKKVFFLNLKNKNIIQINSSYISYFQVKTV